MLWHRPELTITTDTKTCSFFRGLCGERTIWFRLLRSVPIQRTPDLPVRRSIDSLSNSDLRQALLTAARRDRCLRTPAQLKRSTRVVSIDFGRHRNSQAHWDIKLLPEGKSILIVKDCCLELWSVEKNELIWAAPQGPLSVEHDIYDFQLLSEGELIVALIEIVSDDDVNRCVPLLVTMVTNLSSLTDRLFECFPSVHRKSHKQLSSNATYTGSSPAASY